MKPKRLPISPETLRMLELGHPWVIADAVTRRWPKGLRNGELAWLEDSSGNLVGTALLEPRDRVVARLLDAKPLLDLTDSWFEARLEEAIGLRRRHLDLTGTDAYRLVNGEGDRLPGLTVDRYGVYLMLQYFSAAWDPWTERIAGALRRLAQPQGIYLKLRPQKTRELAATTGGRPKNRLLWGRPAGERLEVLENGLKFQVELEEGLHTGLFLDQRENRREFRSLCRGLRILNLFAFTGAFSVAAAAGGATRVTSVDASSQYLEWAQGNFRLNAVNPGDHEFVCGDCLKVLEGFAREGRQFDLVIMDPPSFSTTKKSRFTTRGGTSDLVAAALPLLPKGGTLISSSNHQKVDVADYLKELRRGALGVAGDLQVIGLRGQSGDFPFGVSFPEGRYLKYIISVKS